MLIAEAKLAARLRHANVVQVYDLGREDERLFIAMEYVEGSDLNALLRQLSRSKTPLPLEFALFVVREVLAALSYAHRARDDAGAPELTGLLSLENRLGVGAATRAENDDAHDDQISPAALMRAIKAVVLKPGKNGMNSIRAPTLSSAARSLGSSFSRV